MTDTTNSALPALPEQPDDGELEAWRKTADDLLICPQPSGTTVRQAAHLLQNAYLFASKLPDLRAALAAQPAPVSQECDSPELCKVAGECAGRYGNGAKCRSVAAQPAPVEPADELGWLIEMKFGDGLLWWSGEFEPADDDWRNARLIARMVNDAGKAVRFARREDAQCVLDSMLAARPSPILKNAASLYSVQEHMWPGPSAPVAPAPQSLGAPVSVAHAETINGGKWDGAEYWMPLAWELCAEECGEEACNELVLEGGPVPEPWGDRWLKYEGEARRLIDLVRKHAPEQAAPAAHDAPQSLGAPAAVAPAEPEPEPVAWIDPVDLHETLPRDGWCVVHAARQADWVPLHGATTAPAAQDPLLLQAVDALTSLLDHYALSHEDDWRISRAKRTLTALRARLAAAPAGMVPLSDEQIDALIHSKHFDRSYKKHISDEAALEWYRLGLRDGERAHGIAAPAAKG